MNFWRGIFLVVCSIVLFAIVIFRPESLKLFRRSGSKYHMSRLGGASVGVFLFVVGMAEILNGLALLSGVYVRLIFWLSITQGFAVGFYDTYRNSRLGKSSPSYAGPVKNKGRFLPLIITLVILVGLASIVHPYFPSLDSQDIRLLFSVGLFVLISLIWAASWLQDKWVKRKIAKAMKEALEREGREGKKTDEEDDRT